MTVLIGFAEALAAPETVFSLRRAGHAVRAFCRKDSRALICRHLQIGKPVEICAPEEDATASLNDLARQLNLDKSINCVLALDDPSLWLIAELYEKKLLPDGVKVANAVGGQARFALDKTKQIKAAAKAGFFVPPTTIVRSPHDVDGSELQSHIIKPALVARITDNRLMRGEAIYLTDPENAPAIPDSSLPGLLQPLIHGQGEGVFGFAHQHGVRAWSGHRRIRMMNPHGSGASACVSHSPSTEIRACAERLVMSIGWRGPFMIELLRARDGKAYFMEMNGRLWGSLALARRSGFEYPAWAVQSSLNVDFRAPNLTIKEGRQLRHLGRDIVHLLFVIRGPKTSFHKKYWPHFWPSAGRVLLPGRRKDFYNFDSEYPNYFLRDAVDVILKMLRRRA